MVRAADAAGMDELWLWGDCFSESMIALAAAGPVPAPTGQSWFPDGVVSFLAVAGRRRRRRTRAGRGQREPRLTWDSHQSGRHLGIVVSPRIQQNHAAQASSSPGRGAPSATARRYASAARRSEPNAPREWPRNPAGVLRPLELFGLSVETSEEMPWRRSRFPSRCKQPSRSPTPVGAECPVAGGQRRWRRVTMRGWLGGHGRRLLSCADVRRA